MLSKCFYQTPLACLEIVATEKGVCEVLFCQEKQHKHGVVYQNNRHLTVCLQQLKEYFRGEREKFKLDFDVSGTAFQKKVWQALCDIPYGQVVSYSELAEKIKSPLACRAVGMACHMNPVAIIVPCHRVIGKNKKLTGYAGGLLKKEWLLRHEGFYHDATEPL